MAQHNGRSDTEGMAEFAKQLWERYMRQRVISDLLKHSLDGYKAKVVSNNGDGTLTVIRPYDAQSMTLRCPPGLATWAEAGDQVLVVSLGDASNSFILCATDIDGFESDILSNQDPLMDGTVSPGTYNEASRADHVHPSDTSRVPTSRKINGYDLTQDRTLNASDVGAVPSADKGAAGGVASLDSGGKVPSEQLPDYPVVPSASTANPAMDGTASPGSTGKWADGGHVHPTDTSRVPTSRKINGYDLTQDRTLNAADVGALGESATAAAAYRLDSVYTLSGDIGWYQFATITCQAGNTRSVELLIMNTYAYSWGIMRVYWNRLSSGGNQVRVNWIATTITPEYLRWSVSDDTLTLYIYKTTNTSGRILFSTFGAHNRNGAYVADVVSWSDTAVSEPTSAASAESSLNNTAAKAVNDVDGNSISETYAKAAELGKVLSDPAGVNVSVGEYVSYNGVLYTANTAITSSMAASTFTSYLDAIPDGGLNRLNVQTLDSVYSCYGYRADLLSTVEVQLKKDYVTDGTAYRIFAPLYLLDFSTSPRTVDEYYLMLDQNNASRFVRVTSNNTRYITAMSFDKSTGILTLTLDGTRRYVGADVRISKQYF